MDGIIANIIFSVVDKMLPWGIKKLLPLVTVSPKKIIISKTDEWTAQYSFFVKNRADVNLFDIYVLLSGQNLNFESIQVEKKEPRREFEVQAGGVVLNYELVRFDLNDEKGKSVVVLKIAQADERSIATFQLKIKGSMDLSLRVISFSKEQSVVVFQEGKVAVPFFVPKKMSGHKYTPVRQVVSLSKKV